MFVNEIEALRSEARRLKGMGADIIIAVGHSGFGEDKEIAREVDGLDVVVGGHTNTLLWNGENPLGEVPAGPYPVQVRQPRNRVIESISFNSQCDLKPQMPSRCMTCFSLVGSAFCLQCKLSQ